MDEDWTVTATPVRTRVPRQQADDLDGLDLDTDTLESVTTSRLTKSRASRTGASTSSTSLYTTKSAGKTKAVEPVQRT
jgi:hypothetical protein